MSKEKWRGEVSKAKNFVKFASLGYLFILIIGLPASVALLFSLVTLITALKTIESLLIGFAIGSFIVVTSGKIFKLNISNEKLLDAPTPSDRHQVETELLPKLRTAEGKLEKYTILTLTIMFLNVLKDVLKFLGGG